MINIAYDAILYFILAHLDLIVIIIVKKMNIKMKQILKIKHAKYANVFKKYLKNLNI